MGMLSKSIKSYFANDGLYVHCFSFVEILQIVIDFLEAYHLKLVALVVEMLEHLSTIYHHLEFAETNHQ